MHDAGSMSSRERTGDLRGDIEDFCKLHRRVSHSLAQRLAIDKLGRDEMRALPHRPTPSGLPAWGPRCRATAPLVDLMDGDDVGMIQRGSGLGLLHKALHPIQMSSNIGSQNLQRNAAIEFGILRQIHLTHSALAKL